MIATLIHKNGSRVSYFYLSHGVLKMLNTRPTRHPSVIGYIIQAQPWDERVTPGPGEHTKP